jgi:hypothetical protein
MVDGDGFREAHIEHLVAGVEVTVRGTVSWEELASCALATFEDVVENKSA